MRVKKFFGGKHVQSDSTRIHSASLLPGVEVPETSEATELLVTNKGGSVKSQHRLDKKQKNEDGFSSSNNPRQTPGTLDSALPSEMAGINRNLSPYQRWDTNVQKPMESAANDDKHSLNKRAGKGKNGKSTQASQMQALLVTLVNTGDHDKLYALCKGRREANYCDRAGNTLLMLAAIKGDPECINFLIKKGALVNTENKRGVTALMYAVFYKMETCVQILLQNHANATQQNKKGDTAVEIAAWMGTFDCLHHILTIQSQSPFHSKYIDMERPLSLAVTKNQQRLVELCLNYATSHRRRIGVNNLEIAAKKNYYECPQAIGQHGVGRNRSNQKEFITALIRAATSGSMECLRILLNHVDINLTDETGSTALMYASWNGQKEVLELLTASSHSVNHMNLYGSTALMLAACKGYQECCYILLNNGADCNIQTKHITVSSVDEAPQLDRISALMFAVQGGHSDCVKQLLRGKYIDVNQQNSLGETALILSVIHETSECCDLLVRSGCDVNIPDNKGTTPLKLSLTMKQTEAVKSIVHETSPQLLITPDRDGRTPLMHAIMTDQYEAVEMMCKKVSIDELALMTAVIFCNKKCVQRLIDAGADVNISDGEHDTPLIEAASSGNVKILQLLLHARGEVNSANLAGQTPLMKAAREGHYECLQELVTTAHVNQADLHGLTALMLAAGYGNTECVEILIKHDADVNVHDDGGVTPLMMAAVQGYTDCAQILVKAGASVNQADNDGVTALMNASLGGHKQIVQMLLENGASPNMKNKNGESAYMYSQAYENDDCSILLAGKELTDLVKNGKSKKVRRLLKQRINIDEPDENGETALMTAAWYNQTECLQYLLAAGADVDVKNPDGETALSFASARGNLDCIRHLINYEADVNHCDNFGLTPLMDAAAGGFHSCLEELLIAGADVNYQGFESNTALMLAAERGHEDCVKKLHAYNANVSLMNSYGLTASFISKNSSHNE